MPVLVLFKKGVEVSRTPLDGGTILVGRLAPAQLRLEDPLVSGAHAKVFALEGRWLLRDLSSRNGTYLNGTRVAEASLKYGDEIQIGSATLVFAASTPDELVATAEQPKFVDPKEERKRSGSGERGTTVRLALQSVRDSGFIAREDDRLALVWHGGESLNRLTDRGEILDAVRALVAKVFEPARVFVGGPQEAPSRTVAAEATTSRSAILSKSISGDDRFSSAASVVSAQIETAMAAPLICRDQPLAVIYADRRGGRPFVERDLKLLGLIANHVTSTLENATLIAEFEERVVERTAEVNQLLGIAAHDIRGPLSTILGFLGVARQNLRNADLEALDHDLEVVENAARSVARLLSDLLDLKKIEAGKIKLEVAEIEVAPFLAQATELGALQARQRRIAFDVRAAETGLTVYGDAKRIEQVVHNLVANALKFVRDGGRIEVLATDAPDGGTTFAVTDDGPGMAPEELKRLFEPYVQGEAGKRSGGGTGLGLAIARKLVEMHGGRIWADSEPRKGSRFSFWMPPPIAGQTMQDVRTGSG